MVVVDVAVGLEDPFDDTALDAISLYEMLDQLEVVSTYGGECGLAAKRVCVTCWGPVQPVWTSWRWLACMVYGYGIRVRVGGMSLYEMPYQLEVGSVRVVTAERQVTERQSNRRGGEGGWYRGCGLAGDVGFGSGWVSVSLYDVVDQLEVVSGEVDVG